MIATHEIWKKLQSEDYTDKKNDCHIRNTTDARKHGQYKPKTRDGNC